MTRKQKDLAEEVKHLVELIRRISTAHDIAQDNILHQVELVLIEDDEFTFEKYLGTYKAIDPDGNARLTIPKKVRVFKEYQAYQTEWQDLVFRPVLTPVRKSRAPIIEAS